MHDIQILINLNMTSKPKHKSYNKNHTRCALNLHQVIKYLPFSTICDRCGIHEESIFNKSPYLSIIPVISSGKTSNFGVR